MSPKAKLKITKDVTQLVLARRTRMCNFLEYKDSKVVYRRYASLFFVTGISQGDNELVTLEIIHRYVEVLDRYFGNVCELDLIFNFQKAYAILDELIIAGEMQESSKKSVLRTVSQSDAIEEAEQSEDVSIHAGMEVMPISQLRRYKNVLLTLTFFLFSLTLNIHSRWQGLVAGQGRLLISSTLFADLASRHCLRSSSHLRLGRLCTLLLAANQMFISLRSCSALGADGLLDSLTVLQEIDWVGLQNSAWQLIDLCASDSANERASAETLLNR